MPRAIRWSAIVLMLLGRNSLFGQYELRRDLEAVVRKHGGHMEHLGHQTTTLEDLFLRIIAEAKAHPGRRHVPSGQEEDRGSKVESRGTS